MIPKSRPADTSADAFEAQFDGYRAMSPAQKAACVTNLTNMVSSLAIAGLRLRHPSATERELLLRLAVRRLGADVVERVYGWRAPDDA